MDEIERQFIKLKQRRLELRRKGHKIKEEMIMEEILPHEEREKPLIIEEELVIEKPLAWCCYRWRSWCGYRRNKNRDSCKGIKGSGHAKQASRVLVGGWHSKGSS